MSLVPSGTKSLANREIAREALYNCVRRYRYTSTKTTAAALTAISPFLSISGREVRKLFFNEMPTPMSDATRHSIRIGVANALRHLAAQLRDWANEADDAAWEEETDERKIYALGAD